MIRTAQQIMQDIAQESTLRPDDHRASHLRKKHGEIVPCKNAYRGCPRNGGGDRGGRGWCPRCYDRWRKHGDSWYHKPMVNRCAARDCFMKGVGDHP